VDGKLPGNPRVVLPMVVFVLAVWLVGTWVTKYSLSEMAVYTPIAVAALGLLAGVILLWVKIVRDSLASRRESGSDG
jgi:uncharacterized membrane protein